MIGLVEERDGPDGPGLRGAENSRSLDGLRLESESESERESSELFISIRFCMSTHEVGELKTHGKFVRLD